MLPAAHRNDSPGQSRLCVLSLACATQCKSRLWGKLFKPESGRRGARDARQQNAKCSRRGEPWAQGNRFPCCSAIWVEGRIVPIVEIATDAKNAILYESNSPSTVNKLSAMKSTKTRIFGDRYRLVGQRTRKIPASAVKPSSIDTSLPSCIC